MVAFELVSMSSIPGKAESSQVKSEQEGALGMHCWYDEIRGGEHIPLTSMSEVCSNIS